MITTRPPALTNLETVIRNAGIAPERSTEVRITGPLRFEYASVRFYPLDREVWATYQGSLDQLAGARVRVVGMCECDPCDRSSVPRFVTRLIGGRMVFHSRGTSYRDAEITVPE